MRLPGRGQILTIALAVAVVALVALTWARLFGLL